MNERILTITTVAAVAAAFVAVVLAVVDVFAKTFDIPLGVYLSCILFVLGAHLSYVYARTEDLQRRTSLIERRMAGATVEVFRTRDEWLQRMIELGVNSPFIATLHYSDPPSLLGGRSDEYFRRLKAAICRRTPGIVYRRVATASTPEKVRWLLKHVQELWDCPNFSLAYIDVDHRTTPLLCIEVGQDRGVHYTFSFSTVPTTGTVSAVLVRDDAVGQSALSAFERIWEKSYKLKEGNVVNEQAIQKLAEHYKLLESDEYRAIKEAAVQQQHAADGAMRRR